MVGEISDFACSTGAASLPLRQRVRAATSPWRGRTYVTHYSAALERVTGRLMRVRPEVAAPFLAN